MRILRMALPRSSKAQRFTFHVLPMPDPLNWLLVFLRAIGLLAIFPVFSANNMPVQIRIALAALVSFLVSPLVPVTSLASVDFWGVFGLMIMEGGFGLLLGFASRMLFYAVEVAGGLIATEVGLMIPAGINPMSTSPTSEISTLLQYLAAMLFLTLNLHHGLLLAFQKSFQFLPIGGGHLHESLLLDVLGRTSHLFWFAVQMSAPVRIRNKHIPAAATLYPTADPARVDVVFDAPQRAVTPGQGAVIYEGELVLAGGWIA